MWTFLKKKAPSGRMVLFYSDMRATWIGLAVNLSFGQIVWCGFRPAGIQRLSTGQSHLDGSSPFFRTTKNKSHPFGWLLFFAPSIRTRTIKCNTPVGCCPAGKGPAGSLQFANGKLATSPVEVVFLLYLQNYLQGDCHVASLLAMTYDSCKKLPSPTERQLYDN